MPRNKITRNVVAHAQGYLAGRFNVVTRTSNAPTYLKVWNKGFADGRKALTLYRDVEDARADIMTAFGLTEDAAANLHIISRVV